MYELSFPKCTDPLEILCLGAHADDLEIGCGGTILRILAEREASFQWVVFSSSGERAEEAKRSAEALLKGSNKFEIEINKFRDGFFPYLGGEVKEFFEGLKKRSSPDVIFTHTRDDLHQDHRLISELTWNTFRDHLIFEYEIPKFDGDLGSPNLFFQLDESTCNRKISHLLDFFRTQQDKRWFDEETFRGLMRIRGMEAGVEYAEAFYARKIVI
jgi:LmbE family N-acetylglucosaminyl deacetylase